MNIEFALLTGLALMFVLGLRHGLDPDHIACIDGLTWRALDGGNNASHARWIGTLFALGHGALVTILSMMVHHFSGSLSFPAPLAWVLEWLPTVLLLSIGILNLRQLCSARQQAYRPQGWVSRVLPRRLDGKHGLVSVVVVGMLFAAVFDTATQISAWAYVAGNRDGGIYAALAAGAVFTAGMMVTDTVDCRLVCRINERGQDQATAQRYRRAIGWLIVMLSLGIALYNVMSTLFPELTLGETAFSLLGALMMVIMLAVLFMLKFRHGGQLARANG